MIKRIAAALIVLALALGCAFALAETADTETAAVEGKTRYIATGKGLNIRAAADLDAEVIATPDFNYTVKVIGEEGKWSHVIYESNDKTYDGYCWTAYLSDHKIVVKKSKPDIDGSEDYPGIGYVKGDDGKWHYDSNVEYDIMTRIANGEKFNEKTGEFDNN